MEHTVDSLEDSIAALRSIVNVHGNTQINKVRQSIDNCIVYLEDYAKQYVKNDISKIKIQAEEKCRQWSDYCNSLKSTLAAKEQELVGIKKDYDLLKKNYNDLKSQSKEVTISKVVNSYANVVKSKPSSTNYVCIIEPKVSSVTDSRQTLSLFKSKLSSRIIAQNGIAIKRQKTVNNKKIIVECNTSNDCEKIGSLLKDSGELEVKIPQKWNPRVQILGIEKDVADKEIIDLIKLQNDEFRDLLDEDIKLIRSKDDRVGSKYAILEVRPNIWQLCISSGRLFIGHKCCTVKNFISVLQCQKCLRFGHSKNNCRNSIVCSKCNRDHFSNECTVSNPQLSCNNCTRWNITNDNKVSVDHSSFDRKCPQYIAAFERTKKFINYGY